MNIDERVAQLENQMKVYKRLVIVLSLVIVAGVSMGQSSKYDEIARAILGCASTSYTVKV